MDICETHKVILKTNRPFLSSHLKTPVIESERCPNSPECSVNFIVWSGQKYSVLSITETKRDLHRPGIEPGPPAWQASILPLNQRCFVREIYFLFIYIII